MKILAMVDYAHRTDGGAPQWCKIRPIASADGSRWRQVKDPLQVFPTKGLAFWPPSPPSEALRGSLWCVEVEETQKDDVTDRLLVTHAEPVTGFLTLQGDDGSRLRRSIAEGSFELRHPPPTRVYVSRPGRTGEWVGPFTTREAESEGRWAFEEVAGGFVDLIEVPERDLLIVPDHPLPDLCVLEPIRRLPLPKGCWNVQGDSTLLSSLLKNVRRLDPKVAEGLGLTQRVWRAFSEALTSGGDGVDAHDVARLEAVEELLSWHEADLVRNREFLDTLLEHPALTRRIEEGVLRRVEDAREEVERRARAAVSELTAREGELREEVGRLEKLVEQKVSTVEALGRSEVEGNAALAKVQAELETSIRSVLDRVAEDPVAHLKDHLVARMIVGAVAEGEGSRAPSDVLHLRPDIGEIGEVDALADLVGSHAISRGFDHWSAHSVVGGWLSGRMVACRGPRAFDFLVGVAGAVAGERVWVVPIPARIFGVGDVLALPCARVDGRGSSVLLGDLLSRAHSADHVEVVLLQGINRAPPSHFLEDLLGAMSIGAGGASLPWSVGSDIRSAPVHRPPHTLWCGTIVPGRTCFPVESHRLRRLHLIDSDRATGIPQELRPEAPSLTRVSRSTLLRWSAQAVTPDILSAGLMEFSEEVARMCVVAQDKSRMVGEWLLSRGLTLLSLEQLDQLAAEMGGSCSASWTELRQRGVPERILRTMSEVADA